MKKYRILITLAVVALLCGCANLYTGIVTLTDVRDSAMTELAQLHKAGFINPETDARIAAADATYRNAAHIAEIALKSYKNGGDQATFLKTLEAVRASVGGLIDILRPLSTFGKVSVLDANLKKASQL